MNLQNIFKEIEQTDPEIYERLHSRRKVMHRFTNLSGKLALTALPFALGSMFNKAYGQTPTAIVDILNFMLRLEYLESSFYTKALKKTLINATDIPAFTLINQHETAHVNFLTNTITSLGGVADASPVFDFTANNTYPNVFTNYQVFLQLSQAFEDTCVRAYKGQLTGLITNNDVLTNILQIHSAEARHAAHVRLIRKTSGPNPETSEKPWITSNKANGVNTMQASYAGEDNVVQLGISMLTIPGLNEITATEAFDEPLTMGDVNAIIQPFIK